LDQLGQLPRRALLVQLLRDAVDGVESFLELTYLRKVERAHGLPAGTRQVRFSDANGIVYRDVEYVDYGVVVELDGRAGHENAHSRWRDMARDNAALLAAKPTLRFGYQLVHDPCTAAAQVATVLRFRGCPILPSPCSPACSIPARLGSGAHLT
jgi:hypothetical protein